MIACDGGLGRLGGLVGVVTARRRVIPICICVGLVVRIGSGVAIGAGVGVGGGGGGGHLITAVSFVVTDDWLGLVLADVDVDVGVDVGGRFRMEGRVTVGFTGRGLLGGDGVRRLVSARGR